MASAASSSSSATESRTSGGSPTTSATYASPDAFTVTAISGIARCSQVRQDARTRSGGCSHGVEGRFHRGGVGATQARAVRGGPVDLDRRPGRPDRGVKETSAALKTVTQAAEAGDHGEFVQALARETVEEAKQRKNPLGGFKPKGATAAVEIVDELGAVNGIVTEKATPEEAEAFRALAAGRCAGGGERGEGGRLLRLPRRARQRGRAEDARPATGGARLRRPAPAGPTTPARPGASAPGTTMA